MVVWRCCAKRFATIHIPDGIPRVDQIPRDRHSVIERIFRAQSGVVKRAVVEEIGMRVIEIVFGVYAFHANRRSEFPEI